MFEPPFVMAALVPGALIGAAVLAIFHGGHVPGPISPPSRSKRIGSARRRLATEIERAGWNESPERVAVLAIVLSAGLAAVGLGTAVVLDGATAISLAAAGAATGAGSVLYSLRAAATRRRRRVTRELAPLLELFVLELSGGGSALSALGSVTMQLDGELSLELRRLLIASQVSGSASFESRLRAYAERLEIAPLASLATTLTASREYGTGVTQGVRALAADLRRSQRRELIAHSRRALNHVLFPAAIGVLLPFLAILLYPAVSSLERNLR